jgi:acyl dehydratase
MVMDKSADALSQELQTGYELPALRRGPITRQHLVEWCAAENDYNPLHYDERVAERMSLPGTPIQGTLKFALLGQLIQRWVGRRGALKRISASYRGLNLEGEVIIARAKVRNVEGGNVTLDIWVENEAGTRSTAGEAVVGLRDQ